MLKCVKDTVWAFDLEWVPDPTAGRVLYGLPAEAENAEILAEMWKQNGATEADPFPFLKTVMCRIVSCAVVERKKSDAGVKLRLLRRPVRPEDPSESNEATMVGRFLQGIGQVKPQLVGFNSHHADLKILMQRAVVLGVRAADFGIRPDKPWEGADYFSKGSDWNVDLMDFFGGWGKTSLSLHEIASLSGIPGKFGTAGEQVAHLWLAGQWKAIVDYNCYDALTTYLLWLRTAHFCGFFTDAQYVEEQELVREMIMDESEKEGGEFLTAYFDEWERLRILTGQE